MYLRPSPMVYLPVDTPWCFSKRVWSRHFFSNQRPEGGIRRWGKGLYPKGKWLYLCRDIDVHRLDADILRVRHGCECCFWTCAFDCLRLGEKKGKGCGDTDLRFWNPSWDPSWTRVLACGPIWYPAPALVGRSYGPSPCLSAAQVLRSQEQTLHWFLYDIIQSRECLLQTSNNRPELIDWHHDASVYRHQSPRLGRRILCTLLHCLRLLHLPPQCCQSTSAQV